MRLAVIDAKDRVLLAWPSTADAHGDLADLLAERLAPGRWRKGRRSKIANEIRAHLLELQAQTRTL